MKKLLIIGIIIAALAAAMWLPTQFAGRNFDSSGTAYAGATYIAPSGPAAPPPGAVGYQFDADTINLVTGTTTGIFKMQAPWPMRILGFSAASVSQTGTETIDLTNGTASFLSSALTVSTAFSSATLTTTSSALNVPAGGTIQINTAGTGTANFVSYQIDFVRR